MLKDKLDFAKKFINANLIAILAILLIFSSIANVAFYNKLSGIRENPQDVVKEQNDDLVKKIARLINLPEEQPTIATVADPELLRDQPFFAKAEKGFKVLIYANAGKSVLYDPFNDKVIEVSSITVGKTLSPTK